MSGISEKNTVAVRIFGQEYSISGEMPREHIIRIADYVDSKMNEVAVLLPSGSMSSVAVLTAVNVVEEYFHQEDAMLQLRQQNQQLEKDAQHYVHLWDEVKKSFAQYKEDMASSIEQKEEAQREYQEKEKEIAALREELAELKRGNETLRARVEQMTQDMSHQDHSQEENIATIKELETKCRDIESSFFDIQMENIHLKSELETLRKSGQ
ncbi:MAG: cell division protein ZapA [Bacillota bacterium]|jgi:cell division protein ZapA|nr:cell division protein ZapA [Eubacteriales bacterium]MDI9491890.1 cell division protein ZapA [Bacillota bacterium]NLV70785.1 cell division protein ZapA [Clostridiales bacterium]MDD3537349.1 cell division protein ZapA [Eubacteriales bacterium]MDD4286206.1 cell division protein ZapA [Eubacteriales bacterium]